MKLKFKDDLIRHISIMFLATGLVNVFNLLFQLYMVRSLSPANFGILNSLLAMLMIISVPAGTIQTVITKFVSTYQTTSNPGKIKFLLSSSVRKALFLGLVFLIIFTLGSGYLSSFLQLPSRIPVILIGLTMLFSLILPVTQGGLRGLQKFGLLGLNAVAGGGLKLLLGIVFVVLGFEVLGALGGFVLASFFALCLSFLFLGKVFRYPENEYVDFSGLYRYIFPVASALLCFMVLTNADLILVKHFFNPLEAGYYATAQMVGKIILFLPGAIAVVMFPKTSGLYAKNEATQPVIKKCLISAGLLCGAGAFISILYPSLIIRLLTGKVYVECIQLARLFAIAMTFFALLSVLIFYHLSVHNLKFIRTLAICAILQVVLISLFHNTLGQVLWIMCANAILLFIINIYFAFNPKQRHQPHATQ